MDDSIVEHKEYYNDKVLKTHYITKNGKRHGICKEYHRNGVIQYISDYHNDIMCGRSLTYFDNGQVQMDTYSKKGVYYEYCKLYNKNGKLFEHIVYHRHKNKLVFSLCADYTDNVSRYYIYNANNTTRQYIYNVSRSYDHIIIDLKIINPIRSLQEQFRNKMYSKIFNALNDVININDLSQIVLSYIKN
jgi:hypothetical protein